LVWTIKIVESAKQDLQKLDKPIQKRIVSFVQTKLAHFDNPKQQGKALQGHLPVAGVIGLGISSDLSHRK
jgi:mRNA interferase RelE/StbE